MIDVSKVKVGDEVTLRGVVTAVRSIGIKDCAEVEIEGAKHWYSKSIATHTPKPRGFKPGDRVVWLCNDKHIWKVIAIDAGMAWSRWDGYAGSSEPTPHSPHWGKHDQHLLGQLLHADESE